MNTSTVGNTHAGIAKLARVAVEPRDAAAGRGGGDPSSRAGSRGGTEGGGAEGGDGSDGSAVSGEPKGSDGTPAGVAPETGEEHDLLRSLGFPASTERSRSGASRTRGARRLRAWLARVRKAVRESELARDERGAVTAEYALVIMAAVAFAGLLIVIMRSEEVRSMLLSLVQNALGSAG